MRNKSPLILWQVNLHHLMLSNCDRKVGKQAHVPVNNSVYLTCREQHVVIHNLSFAMCGFAANLIKLFLMIQLCHEISWHLQEAIIPPQNYYQLGAAIIFGGAAFSPPQDDVALKWLNRVNALTTLLQKKTLAAGSGALLLAHLNAAATTPPFLQLCFAQNFYAAVRFFSAPFSELNCFLRQPKRCIPSRALHFTQSCSLGIVCACSCAF